MSSVDEVDHSGPETAAAEDDTSSDDSQASTSSAGSPPVPSPLADSTEATEDTEAETETTSDQFANSADFLPVADYTPAETEELTTTAASTEVSSTTAESIASSVSSTWSSWRSSFKAKLSEAAQSDLAASVGTKLTKVATSTKGGALSIASYLQSTGDRPDFEEWLPLKERITSETEKAANALGMYYISDDKRIIAMGFPTDETILSGTRLGDTLSQLKSSADSGSLSSRMASSLLPSSKAVKVSRFLHKWHRSSHMVWNLSEVSYSERMRALFNDCVIDFRFPGYPCPPLHQLFEILASIQNWLNANEENVAVVHCQTGKGRTVTVLSAYLAWAKMMQSPAKALMHTVQRMQGTVKSHTIPSQTRYLAYLTQLLMSKQKPLTRPIAVERIIIHGIPYFEISKNSDYHLTKMYLRRKHALIQESTDSTAETTSDSLTPSTEAKTKKKSRRQSLLGTVDSEDDTEEAEPELGVGLSSTAKSPLRSPKSRSKSPSHSPKIKALNPPPRVKKYSPTKEDMGIRPYIQIFKNAKLIWSSRTDARRELKRQKKLRSKKAAATSVGSDGMTSFDTDTAIDSAVAKRDCTSSSGAAVVAKSGGVFGKEESMSLLLASGGGTGAEDFEGVAFYDQSDRVMKFHVGGSSKGTCPMLDGDILVRVRHLCGDGKKKVSVCRFTFHSGYVAENGLVRFKKAQLDGAWNSDRFAEDFAIDMVTGSGQSSELTAATVADSFWDDIDRHTLVCQSDERRMRRLQQQKMEEENARRKREAEERELEKLREEKEALKVEDSEDALDEVHAEAVVDSDAKSAPIIEAMEEHDILGVGLQTVDELAVSKEENTEVVAAVVESSDAPAVDKRFTLGTEDDASLTDSSDEEEEALGTAVGAELTTDALAADMDFLSGEMPAATTKMDDGSLFEDAGDSHRMEELERMAETIELGSDDEDLLNELEAIAADEDDDDNLP